MISIEQTVGLWDYTLPILQPFPPEQAGSMPIYTTKEENWELTFPWAGPHRKHGVRAGEGPRGGRTYDAKSRRLA